MKIHFKYPLRSQEMLLFQLMFPNHIYPDPILILPDPRRREMFSLLKNPTRPREKLSPKKPRRPEKLSPKKPRRPRRRSRRRSRRPENPRRPQRRPRRRSRRRSRRPENPTRPQRRITRP